MRSEFAKQRIGVFPFLDAVLRVWDRAKSRSQLRARLLFMYVFLVVTLVNVTLGVIGNDRCC